MAKKKEVTVEAKLRALYDLQLIDSRVDEIRNVRGELPLEVEDLEDEVAGLNKRIEKLDNELALIEDQIKANLIKATQRRSQEIKEDQTKSTNIKEHQSKSSKQIKNDQRKSTQSKEDRRRSNEIEEDQISSEKINEHQRSKMITDSQRTNQENQRTSTQLKR